MKILCIDFDGVLHSYTSGWKGVDKVVDPATPGAMQFLVEAAKTFNLCVYSSRSKEPAGIGAMQGALFKWLRSDLGYNDDEAIGFIARYLSFPTEKPAAFLTIDDRAVCFKGEFPTIEQLHNFKTWTEINRDAAFNNLRVPKAD
jgi:hypothetical protein